MKIDFSFSSYLKRASIWLRVESPFPIGTTKHQTNNIRKPPANELFELASLILYINMVMTMSLHLIIPFHSVRVFFFTENCRYSWHHHHFIRKCACVCVCLLLTEDGSHFCHPIQKFYSYGRKGESDSIQCETF